MPKRVDVDSQRRAIADAAIEVIGDAGLERTRLRDVAGAAGVTTGALTHYFDGKDAVLEAALAEVVRRILARQDQGRSTPVDVPTFIVQACAYLPLDAGGLREWRVWLAFWGRAITDDRRRAMHHTYYSQILDRLIERLPSLRTGDPPATGRELARCADAVVAAIDGVGIRATLEPELWPPARQRDVLSSLLLPTLTAFADGGASDYEES